MFGKQLFNIGFTVQTGPLTSSIFTSTPLASVALGAVLTLGQGIYAVWLGLSPTWFSCEEFGQFAGAVIDIQAHFHGSLW